MPVPETYAGKVTKADFIAVAALANDNEAAIGLTKIAHTVLGSSAASISFTSIPGTYEDLYLDLLDIASGGNNSVGIRFNGDTGSNYDFTRFYGNGSVTGSDGSTGVTSGTITSVGAASPGLAAVHVVIGKYARTNAHKTALAVGARVDSGTGLPLALHYTARWRSTAAITQIDLIAVTNNFAAGTVATLYGTKVA